MIEECRPVGLRTFDCQQPQLAGDTSRGRKTTGLAAGGQHAMTRDDRAGNGFCPERLTNVGARFVAQPFGNFAVSQRGAGRNARVIVVDLGD